jgi:predicted acylesterase/phospholipase RssA
MNDLAAALLVGGGGCDNAEATLDPAGGNGDSPSDDACRLGVLDVLSKGSAVVQAHIAAAKLRDDPPDAMLVPRSEHIGVFELMRCAEAIELGRESAQRAMPELLALIEKARRSRSTRLRRLFGSTAARRRAL